MMRSRPATGAANRAPMRRATRVAATALALALGLAAAAAQPAPALPDGAPSGSAAPLRLISRDVPAYAPGFSSGARHANDADYRTKWRSSGVPTTLAYDLSEVPVAQRQRILLAWYNDDSYGYDHALIGQPGYNNAGAYTIEIHRGEGGGRPPADGWVAVASRSGNTRHSMEHVIDAAGANWVRIRFTASDGSPRNADIAIKLDVYDAAAGVGDGWFFAGDSITANCMSHGDTGGEDADNPTSQTSIKAPPFGLQVEALAGTLPPQENAGMPGWTAADAATTLAGWLADFPGRYVTLNFGTNDAAGGVSPGDFESRLAALVKIVQGAGKIAVIPTIPFAREPTHQRNIPALNARIRALPSSLRGVIAGPDLWEYFRSNPRLVSSDGIHLNAQGCAAYRTLWAQHAAQQIYRR